MGSPSLACWNTSYGSRAPDRPIRALPPARVRSRTGVRSLPCSASPSAVLGPPPWRFTAISGRRSGLKAEDGLADPARLLAVEPAELEPFLGLRAVPGDHRSKLVPRRLGVGPDLRRLVQAKLGV